MMAARFQPGELVDLTIRGARVGESTSKHHQFTTGDGDLFIAVELLPSIMIERVAPAEWPPQPGDKWLDAHGGAWFAPDRAAKPSLISTKGGESGAGWVLTEYGPMTLAHREGWTPTPAGDVDQADKPKPTLDERAAKAAGLRELADFIEAHLDLPIRKYGSALTLSLFVDDHDELERVAAMLGVEPDSRTVPPHPFSRHRYARKTFTGGVKIEAVICDVYPQVEPTTDITPSPPEEVAGSDVAASGPATAPDETPGGEPS